MRAAYEKAFRTNFLRHASGLPSPSCSAGTRRARRIRFVLSSLLYRRCGIHWDPCAECFSATWKSCFYSPSVCSRPVRVCTQWKVIIRPIIRTWSVQNRILYKIEFNPIRATLIPGTQDIGEVHSIAVSAQEDKLVVSGRYRRNQPCGVFEIHLPGGLVDNIIETPDCRYVSAWLSLSLSPTAEHGVAVHERHLELIDFAKKSVVSLGDGYSEASWSPDGRWIAALEWAKQRTVLLDGREFSGRAVLGDSEVRWSPESRFLLRVRPCRFSDSGTIEALEIASGKTVVVKSSNCEVYQPTTGWVSRSILP
jgi:hypothetical protein